MNLSKFTSNKNILSNVVVLSYNKFCNLKLQPILLLNFVRNWFFVVWVSFGRKNCFHKKIRHMLIHSHFRQLIGNFAWWKINWSTKRELSRITTNWMLLGACCCFAFFCLYHKLLWKFEDFILFLHPEETWFSYQGMDPNI